MVGARGENGYSNQVNGDQSARWVNYANPGAAYVFTRAGGTWIQQAYLKAPDVAFYKNFGGAVAISGEVIVVGSDAHPFYHEGSAYAFVRVQNQWQYKTTLRASNGERGDGFGAAVAISGGTAVVGAPGEASSSTGVNGLETDNGAPSSGAGYVYTGLEPPPTPGQLFNSAAAAAGLNGTDALPNATPFGDGVPNLLKYAFNLNLAGPDHRTLTEGGNSGLPAHRIVSTVTGNVFRYEFVRRVNAGLLYTPRTSTDLGNGQWQPLESEPVVTVINDDWVRVVHEEPFDPATTPRCFFSVEVDIP